MKIKDTFILSQVDDSLIAVPVDAAAESYHGIVRLNETGGFIWKALADGLEPKQIEAKLMSEYSGVDVETAGKAVAAVVNQLRSEGILEE
jgi:hypothetical protein